jgi:glycosyltransferase involved in cell wall biosynthesis
MNGSALLVSRSVLDEGRLCLFVPCYQASRLLEGTVGRVKWAELPQELSYRVVFVDNRSTDPTWEKIQQVQARLRALGVPSHAIRNLRNLGYGGSNKVIFDYCIENDIGLVGILHSDGQYLPEELPRLVREFLAHPRCAMFYGSRLQGAPLQGGMPRYRFVANVVLTWLQNRALSAHYGEYHSGYRFYRLNEIRQLPYHENSDYYHFDSHIMFQIHHSGGIIDETEIPTRYGDETSYINPFKCVGGIVGNAFVYILHRWGVRRVKRYSVTRLERCVAA